MTDTPALSSVGQHLTYCRLFRSAEAGQAESQPYLTDSAEIHVRDQDQSLKFYVERKD